MKPKNYFFAMLSVALLIICSGCDYTYPVEEVKNGEFFKHVVINSMNGVYCVNFSPDNTPIVDILYKKNGVEKSAEFQLDGYDPEKKIGYKIVLEKDKTNWEDKIKKGDQEVPDLNDSLLIQEAALKYQFPVIFMWGYQYQKDTDYDRLVDDGQTFMSDFNRIADKPEILGWAEKGMYDGRWIKEGIEQRSAEFFQINFANTNPPTIDLKYDTIKEAVFQIDGYDSKRQIGYKFVTEDEAYNWGMELGKGNHSVPNLFYIEQIKEAALNYEFPVIFIYVPEYWKGYIAPIFTDEVSKPLTGQLKPWLDNHK